MLLAVGCNKAVSDPSSAAGRASTSSGTKSGEVIAQVGAEKVTVEDLQKKLDEQSPFIRARYADMEKRKELLDAQVRFEVLAAEAMTRGYTDDPEVKEALKKLLVQRLTREEFDGRIQLKDITDAELQTYFDEHRAEYDKPELVRASVITVSSSTPGAKEKASEAQRLAADASKKEDRVFFKELVARFSTDEATKPAGGDARYLSKAEATTRFGAEAAEWLFGSNDLNAVSPLMTSTTAAGQAFHVLKRTGKRDAISRSFEQVKNQIRNVVYREKRTAAFNAFVEGLKTKHGAVSHPEKLAQLTIPTLPPGALAQLPGAHGGHDDDGHDDDDDGDERRPAASGGSDQGAQGGTPKKGASPDGVHEGEAGSGSLSSHPAPTGGP